MTHRTACRHALLVAAALACACNGSSGPTPPSKNCQYTVTPAQVTPCMPAAQFSATVTTQAGCTWVAAAGASWLSIASGASGSGTGVVSFAVTANYDAPRTGAVTVRWPTNTTGQDVQVAQAGCLYAVSQSSFAFGAVGGVGAFVVYTFAEPNTCGGPLQNACAWTAQANVPWIQINSTMPRGDQDPLNFTVERNSTGAERTGTITVRDKTVQITQAG